MAAGNRERENLWGALRHALWSTEYLTLFMLAVYTTLCLIFLPSIASPFAILQLNILVAVATVAIPLWYDQTGGRLAHIFRSFYVLPIGYMFYAQIHNYIPLVHPVNYDDVLAAWDRDLFGVNPTEWIYRFANPFLTEYLQVWYNFFQLMLVFPAVSFYRQNAMRKFRVYSMVLLFGFYLSYLGYFAMPAIGPRFQVHDFHAIDRELPGLLLTEPFRAFINAGNNITPQMTDPYAVVNRDCMPSGHTMMSVLGILMAWRLRSRWRWFITVGGVSVVVSTIYLRYHYMVDMMAGTALAFIVFWTYPWVVKLWEERWKVKV